MQVFDYERLVWSTPELGKGSFCHYELMDLDRGLRAVRDSRLTPRLSGAMNVLIRRVKHNAGNEIPPPP